MSKAIPKKNNSYSSKRGSGDELHQHIPKHGDHSGKGHLTTNQGARIADNQNQLKVGERGPVLLEDFVLREKIFHFDHERIPERIVHARGTAAHGYFELYESLANVTRADLLQRKGERTPVFVRFSTVAGGAGSVDTPRDVRGFAVKFYTKEGNWDLVGNNIPVFFIQDAIKFPDLVHAAKMEADRGYPQSATAHDTFWDFIGLMPESTHMMMWIMSDRTLPRSFSMMEGFGVHTFRFVDGKGKSTFVKFHWKPKAGLQSTIWDETVKIAGADPDYQRRDLFDRINRGDYPEWELGLQLFDQRFADGLSFDVLDPTKIIPEELLPVKIVGRLVLDRNVDNFFAETEQVAFCPANVVPGIDFTNDPLLQGRLFSYLDTQKSRLGTANFNQIPINAPKCPFANFQRDGMMQMQVPKGRANYEPNSLSEVGEESGPRECPVTGFVSAATAEVGDKLRVRPESFSDHYSQARLFYTSLDPAEQAHLASALVFELSKVSQEHIRVRIVGNLMNVDLSLAKRVASGIGLKLPKASVAKVPLNDAKSSAAVRVINGPRSKDQAKSAIIGILVAPGSNAEAVTQLKASAKKVGAHTVVVAPRIGKMEGAGGTEIDVDVQLAGAPSVIFDAVAVVLSQAGCEALLQEAAAIQFVMDAYGHCKAIGADSGAQPLLDRAGVEPDEGISKLGPGFMRTVGRRFYAREAKVRSLS